MPSCCLSSSFWLCHVSHVWMDIWQPSLLRYILLRISEYLLHYHFSTGVTSIVNEGIWFLSFPWVFSLSDQFSDWLVFGQTHSCWWTKQIKDIGPATLLSWWYKDAHMKWRCQCRIVLSKSSFIETVIEEEMGKWGESFLVVIHVYSSWEREPVSSLLVSVIHH